MRSSLTYVTSHQGQVSALKDSALSHVCPDLLAFIEFEQLIVVFSHNILIYGFDIVS